MQFLVIGHDGTDEKARDRRATAREAHLKLGDQMKADGTLLYATAILNDADQMIGSVLVCNFQSREKLDEWLILEPYVTGNVWKKIDIQKCKVGPSFQK